MTTHHRRFFWAWGREFRYRDLTPNDPDGDDLLPFGHIWLGFFTLAKDTGKPWWRGWTFRWNRKIEADEPKLTDAEEREAQQLHRELCEDVAAGNPWGSSGIQDDQKGGA